MDKKDYCQCTPDSQQPKRILGRNHLTCLNCKLVIEESLDTKETSTSWIEIDPSDNRNFNPRIMGVESAKRVLKYATLFEKISKFLQTANLIAVSVLFLAGLFLELHIALLFVYWVAVAALWGFGYLQVALIQGLASYFQMKACEHLSDSDR